MADRNIGALPTAPQVADDSLIPIEQQGKAMKMTGAQFRKFAQDSASGYVGGAKEEADRAEASAQSASNSAKAAAGSASTAQQYSGNPPKPISGTWWVWNATSGKYEDTGVSSVLTPKRSYASVADMEADFPNTNVNDIAMISASTEEEDTAKIYINNGREWQYLADLSGMQGPTGPKGEKGDPGATVATDKIFGFHVNEAGHLILSYAGDAPPNAYINSNGHLIMEL